MALGGADKHNFFVDIHYFLWWRWCLGTFAVLSESGDAGTWDPTLSGLDRHVLVVL